MNAGIRQMQIRYDALQDRLLFILSSAPDTEFKFWFTRRYVKMLWPLLQRSLERLHSSTTAALRDPLQKQAMLSFHHEQAVSQSNFSAPYQEIPQPTYPLGEEPVLAAKASLLPDKQRAEVYQFSIHPEQGKGVEIRFDGKLLHAFAKLLSDAVAQSGWDLKYRLGGGTLPVQQAPDAARLIN